MLKDSVKPLTLYSDSIDDWHEVLRIKNEYINTGTCPDSSIDVPSEILTMWLSAAERGIPRFDSFEIPKLTKPELGFLMEKKELMLDLFYQYCNVFNTILTNTSFIMSLCDENGVMLTHPADHLPMKDWGNNLRGVGDVWHEDIVGCCAHTLALKYGRPVQIIGSANYISSLEKNAAHAAPIYDENDEITGCIIMVQLKEGVFLLSKQTMGWVNSIARAISSQIKLARRNKHLKVMDSTLSATFDPAPEGFLLIDNEGHIINLNNEAKRILRISDSKVKAKVYSFFKEPFHIYESLHSCIDLINKKMEVTTNQLDDICIDVKPLEKLKCGRASGAIIRLCAQNKQMPESKRFCRKSRITFRDIVTRSPNMLKLKEVAEKVASKPVNVMLLGESGTGKELFARALHNANCPEQPFVAINCASIPKHLIASELFGYEKCAFTGALTTGKRGKIEEANGGTLFLDEIGDMPLELQPVLLRALEEREIVRIGGNKPVPVNFRVISATNNPLVSNVKAEKFRQDLFFRLSVINLLIPPLRDRTDDILILAKYFICRTCDKFGLEEYVLAKDTEELLTSYCWPGNVRQLENAILYAVSVANGTIITPHDLPMELFNTSSNSKCKKLDEIRNIEKDLILATIDQVGSVQDAAKYLGISTSTIYRKMKENIGSSEYIQIS